MLSAKTSATQPVISGLHVSRHRGAQDWAEGIRKQQSDIQLHAFLCVLDQNKSYVSARHRTESISKIVNDLL